MKRMLADRRNGSGGFTLIELLTVVSIIGLLLAILLPSLQQARRTADRLGCVSQLRTIGVAMHLYHDTHGRLPGPTNARQGFLITGGTAVNSSSLLRNLYPFLGLPEYKTWMRNTEARVMRCPAHRRMLGDALSPDYPHPLYAICYIVNRGGPRVMGSNNSAPDGVDHVQSDPSTWLQPLPLIGVLSLARIWTVMDADSEIYLDALGRERRILLDYEPPFVAVHGTVRNVLFLDGHVESYPAASGPPPNPTR